MLRIFLTSDNHIGLKYASHSEAAVLRSKRITAFEGMVQKANEENCALFVIAGDLFENTYGISKGDIKSLLNILSRFSGTVVVLPGNHDYYDDGVKVWQHFKDIMKSYDNIMLITEYKPYKLNIDDRNVVLYPAHCTSLHSAPGENNLSWIKNEPIVANETFKIGIAHGAVEGETIDNEGAYFLMERSELESIPMDVWLIGHTHVTFPKNIKEDEYTAGEKIFNAGTHVQTDVSCNTEGQCFIIEIDDDKTVRAKKYSSGNIHFYRKNITVYANELETKLNSELSEIPENSVVDIILSGAVSTAEYENCNKTLENALSKFIEGTYDVYNLSKLITKDLINAEYSETSFSAAFLTALLDEPKEAQLTYELLKSLREGK